MRGSKIFLSLLVVVAGFAGGAFADEFRVENSIYRDGQKTPIHATLTLFPKGGVVYDFSFGADGEQIEQATVYDFPRHRFMLVDYAAGVKLEINETEVLEVLGQLLAKVESNESLLKEAANPEFETAHGDGIFRFNGKFLKYEIHTFSPSMKRAPRDYQRFADWSARLTTLQPHGLPPNARIKINDALASEQLLPKEVIHVRSVGAIWENDKKLRSIHTFHWQLTRSDKQRMETLHQKMASMESVGLRDYFERVAVARSSDKSGSKSR